MNTRAVAQLLGISTSTVQRWVKQLNLEMEKNEQGHYIFSEENIETLKQIKLQLQQGLPLHDISADSKKRSGSLKTVHSEENIDKLAVKINQIEGSLHQKADSVVSYQLLQHRREIEDLQEQISSLSDRLAQIEGLLHKEAELAAASEIIHVKDKKTNRKKYKWLQIILGNF